MKKIIFVFLLIFYIMGYSQNKFNNKPWDTNENINFAIIIDPYRGNVLNFDEIMKENKVNAIIHKASQGLNEDSEYVSRAKLAKDYNLKYASYHLGTNDDPIKQADFYLNVIKNNLEEPMALDIEDFQKKGKNVYMPLESAIIFIKRIYKKTGKYPILYINNKVFEEINKKYGRESIFSKCPLWYARFVEKLPSLNTRIWNEVTIWQFASEINCKKCAEKDSKGDCKKWDEKYSENCPLKIKGTEYNIDIDVFNGSIYKMNDFWKSYYNDGVRETLIAKDIEKKIFLQEVYKKGKRVEVFFKILRKGKAEKMAVLSFFDKVNPAKLNGNPSFWLNSNNDYADHVLIESNKDGVLFINKQLEEAKLNCPQENEECVQEGSNFLTISNDDFLKYFQ